MDLSLHRTPNLIKKKKKPLHLPVLIRGGERRRRGLALEQRTETAEEITDG